MINKTLKHFTNNFLDEILISALKEVLNYCSSSGITPAFVLLGGSVGEGFANESSDIDFVVIQVGSKDKYTKQFIVSNRRVEITIYTLEEFRKSITMNSQSHAGPTFFRQLDSRRRLLFSKPIYRSEVYKKEMENAKIQDFVQDLVTFQKAALLRSFTDAVCLEKRSIHEDDLRIRARTYLESSVDVFLTSIGDYYFRDKWRVARVQRSLNTTHLNFLRNSISSLMSGRALINLNDLEGWLTHTYFYSTACQYLAIFKNLSLSRYSIFDVCQVNSKTFLSAPLVITEQENKIMVRSRKSTLLLSPDLANAACLSALGVHAAEACEIVYESRGSGIKKTSPDKFLSYLFDVNEKLGLLSKTNVRAT